MHGSKIFISYATEDLNRVTPIDKTSPVRCCDILCNI